MALDQCCPHGVNDEGTSIGDFGTQSHGFDIRCLRFDKDSCPPSRKARFRLVVSLYREGVKPSGLLRKVSAYCSLPPSPGLSWRYHSAFTPAALITRAQRSQSF